VPVVKGYGVHSFLLNNRQLGEKQNRVRRWSFGWRGSRKTLTIETVAVEHPEFETAALGGGGGGGCARHGGSTMPFNCRSEKNFSQLCEKQGLPADYDLPPFKVLAKCQAVGNGVPFAMGTAIAKAIKELAGRIRNDKRRAHPENPGQYRRRTNGPDNQVED